MMSNQNIRTHNIMHRAQNGNSNSNSVIATPGGGRANRNLEAKAVPDYIFWIIIMCVWRGAFFHKSKSAEGLLRTPILKNTIILRVLVVVWSVKRVRNFWDIRGFHLFPVREWMRWSTNLDQFYIFLGGGDKNASYRCSKSQEKSLCSNHWCCMMPPTPDFELPFVWSVGIASQTQFMESHSPLHFFAASRCLSYPPIFTYQGVKSGSCSRVNRLSLWPWGWEANSSDVKTHVSNIRQRQAVEKTQLCKAVLIWFVGKRKRKQTEGRKASNTNRVSPNIKNRGPWKEGRKEQRKSGPSRKGTSILGSREWQWFLACKNVLEDLSLPFVLCGWVGDDDGCHEAHPSLSHSIWNDGEGRGGERGGEGRGRGGAMFTKTATWNGVMPTSSS